MRRSVGASVLVAGICLLLSGEAWGSPINVTYWRLASYASDTASGTGATEADEIVRFPMNEALTAEAGASKATVQHSFQATDTQVDLYSEFQEQRGGVRLSPWEYDGTGNTIYVRFTAPQDARFRINGEVLLGGHSGGNMSAGISLVEDTGQRSVFDYSQYGVTAPGQEYDWDGAGVLSAGHEYIFAATVGIYPNTPDDGAAASGWVHFQVTPEPVTGLSRNA